MVYRTTWKHKPEIDIKKLATSQKIFSYVRNGGIFINSAGVPLYYAYNIALRRFVDTTDPTVTSSQTNNGTFEVGFTRFFQLSVIARELGLSLVGFPSGQQFSINHIIGNFGMVGLDRGRITFRRSVIVDSNIESCVDPLPVMHNGVKEMTPLFFVRYGDGDFLLSLAWFTDELNSFDNKIGLRDSIAKLLLQKVSSRKALLGSQ